MTMNAQQKAEAGMRLLREAICDFLRSNGGSASAREIRDALPTFERAGNSDPLWGVAKPMVEEGTLRLDKTGNPHRIVLT